jgi:multisubunit Na+/H+ antiporter MnhC subunit
MTLILAGCGVVLLVVGVWNLFIADRATEVIIGLFVTAIGLGGLVRAYRLRRAAGADG